MLKYFRGNYEIPSMPKKSANLRFDGNSGVIMSSQLSASSHCLLHMFRCKFIILFYDDGARRNLKITYNYKRPYYQDYNRTSKQQNNRTDLQTYAFYASGKIVLFFVIFKQIIVAFIT